MTRLSQGIDETAQNEIEGRFASCRAGGPRFPEKRFPSSKVRVEHPFDRVGPPLCGEPDSKMALGC